MNSQITEQIRSIRWQWRHRSRPLFGLACCVLWGVGSGAELPTLKHATSFDIEYPPSARRANEEGIVAISFLIDSNGRPQDQLVEAQANTRFASAVQAGLKRVVFDVPENWGPSGNARLRRLITFHFTLGDCSNVRRFDRKTAAAYVCGVRIEPRTPGPDCSSLDAIHAARMAREQWNNSRPQSYSYDVRIGAMYFYSDWPETRLVRVTVRNGNVKEPATDFVQRYRQYLTIDGMFDRIADIAATAPDCLTVRFDPTIGFPTTIYFDPDLNVSDSSETIEVVGFRPK